MTGYTVGMITVQRTLTVTVPVESVFGYLADFTTTEQWDPGTVRTVRTGTGPIGQGATFHNISEFRGRRTELDYTLSTYRPNEHLVFEGTNSTVDSADDLTLRPTGSGGTEITYQARFRFKGLYRLAEPFLRRGFEPIADTTVDQLRGCLERL